MSRNKASQGTKNNTGGMAGLDKYGKQPHMIEIEKIVTSKNCPWSSKNLVSMVPYNEIASRHETGGVV